MDNFFFILNAILPLFLICLAGVGLRHFLKYGDREASVVNRVCYYALLPCLLFRNAYNSDFSAIRSAWPYVYAVVFFCIWSFVVTVIAKHTVEDPKKAGGFAHSAPFYRNAGGGAAGFYSRPAYRTADAFG